MDEVNDKIMVALIPNEVDWCKIDFPHVTLIYGGKTIDSKNYLFNELAKEVSSLAMITNSFWAKVSGIEVFGEEEKVDVLRLDSSPELLSMRNLLEDWDTGEFPIYKPHATIGPVGSSNGGWNSQSTPMPMMLYLNRIAVCWGENCLLFWLRNTG